LCPRGKGERRALGSMSCLNRGERKGIPEHKPTAEERSQRFPIREIGGKELIIMRGGRNTSLPRGIGRATLEKEKGGAISGVRS